MLTCLLVGPGAPSFSPRLRPILKKCCGNTSFGQIWPKLHCGSTLSAMSIVGEPSILLLRHIQTSPLTPHALNSSAAKKVLFIFHHWFCYHATLSKSGSDLKQLTLICSRKTNFFSQFPTFWLTSRSSSSWRQVWGGSGSSAGSLPLHISTDGHGGHTAEPIEHRHALSSLQLWLDDLTPTAGAVVVVILCAE